MPLGIKDRREMKMLYREKKKQIPLSDQVEKSK